MFTHKIKVIILVVLILTIVLLIFIGPSIYDAFSSTIFSRFHFFEENKLNAQVIDGKDINKYSQVRWDDPDDAKSEQENPEKGLSFNVRYEGDRSSFTTKSINIFDIEGNKIDSLSLPSSQVLNVEWLNNGLFVHGEVGKINYDYQMDQDFFYDLEKKVVQPIQSDGLRKSQLKMKQWFLHPKNRNYLLETYCLSTATGIPEPYCKQWGVSIITSTKSVNILSFYHIFRQELRIGWDDKNFYVKTGVNPSFGWVSDGQSVQGRQTVDTVDSGDKMYIIPLENLKNL